MDKRKNIRVEYSTFVEIQQLGIPDKPKFTATTKSLSIGGILLESPTPLDKGAKIQINISLDSTNPFLIIGTVGRSEKIDSGNHEISVAFIDSDKVFKNEISSYLIKHLKEIPYQSLGAPQSPS